MTNQEQTAKNVIKTGNKANSDMNHASQITQAGLDEVENISQGAQEGDVTDIALEDAEDLL